MDLAYFLEMGSFINFKTLHQDATVRIDLPPIWPNGQSGLGLHPDQGRSAQYSGWWAPVAQPYKEKVEASISGYEVRQPPVSPPPSLVRSIGGLQRREAPLCHRRCHRTHGDSFTASGRHCIDILHQAPRCLLNLLPPLCLSLGSPLHDLLSSSQVQVNHPH